jgi:hypothetical protein
MSLRYSHKQQNEFLILTDWIGGNWLKVFEGNTDFYTAHYWDLMKELWRQPAPVRKTDALGFMGSIKSPHTAAKYIDAAIREGYLIEIENPGDARSRLLSLSPEMRERLDKHFDGIIGELFDTVDRIKND